MKTTSRIYEEIATGQINILPFAIMCLLCEVRNFLPKPFLGLFFFKAKKVLES